MRKDGINVSQSPDDFYRPKTPPAAPPATNVETVKPLPCRCDREADWLLDGSLFGCNTCFVSGTSMADWNALVGGEQQPTEVERLQASLVEMTRYRDNAANHMRRIRAEATAFEKERDQLKAENEALRGLAELVAKKLRSAEICNPRAVEFLLDEARAALADYLPKGWPLEVNQ